MMLVFLCFVGEGMGFEVGWDNGIKIVSLCIVLLVVE